MQMLIEGSEKRSKLIGVKSAIRNVT